MGFLVALIEDRRLGLALLGSLGIAVGSALPWIVVPQPLAGTATGYGLQDDGKITIVLGLLAFGLVLAYAQLKQRDLIAVAAVAGLGAAGLAGYYLANLDRNAARVVTRMLSGTPIEPATTVDFPSRIGVGIWVLIGGAAVLGAAGIGLMLRGAGTSEPASQSSL
jgi:hypothetical protein